jgi:hypothetical protein
MDNLNIVITLTTIPSRLISNYEFDIKYCLNSLLSQTYNGEYEVHLNIPYFCKKTNSEYVIPDWLIELVSKDDRLKIFRTDDYGPLSKLLPTLERIQDDETIIIVVDDDMIYHQDLIKEHINNQKKWINSPVGYDGIRSRNEIGAFSNYFGDNRDYYYSGTHRDSRVDILQHYKSISYKRRFFTDDFKDFFKEYYTWNDDLLVSAYFASKKIERYATYYESDLIYENYDDWMANVGKTFPIVQNTHHETVEGCNLFRRDNDDDNSSKLYKFIDTGYEKNNLVNF